MLTNVFFSELEVKDFNTNEGKQKYIRELLEAFEKL